MDKKVHSVHAMDGNTKNLEVIMYIIIIQQNRSESCCEVFCGVSLV